MNVSSMNSEGMRYIAIGHMFQYLTSVSSSIRNSETLYLIQYTDAQHSSG